MTTDIFSVIAARDRAVAAEPRKRVKAWALVRGDGTRLATSKLYSFTRARKVAARAQRMGIDVYVAVFGFVNVTAAQRSRM